MERGFCRCKGESRLRKESRLNVAGRTWAAEFRLSGVCVCVPTIPCNRELRDAGRSVQTGVCFIMLNGPSVGHWSWT